MQRMGRFHAGSPAKCAGPGAVFRMTPKEVEQWIMKLHPLDVGTAHIASARIDPIFIDPGAVPVESAVGHIDESAVAPILVHSRMPAVPVAGIGRDDLVAPLLAGREHLHQHGAREEPYAEPR